MLTRRTRLLPARARSDQSSAEALAKRIQIFGFGLMQTGKPKPDAGIRVVPVCGVRLCEVSGRSHGSGLQTTIEARGCPLICALWTTPRESKPSVELRID